MYDIDTNTYETRLLPAELVVEIECNNFEYSERKYGQLSTPTFDANELVIWEDSTTKCILFSQNVAKSKFQITNMQGATVLAGEVNNSNTIDAATLQDGIYIVGVEINSKRVDKKLILK